MPRVRMVLSAIAALLFLVAGTQMREQGSGIDPSLGLLAYGAAFAILAYGAGGWRSPSPRPQETDRSYYDET